MRSKRLMRGLGLALASFTIGVLQAAAQSIPSTTALTETTAGVGALGSGDQQSVGPAAGPTSAASVSVWPLSGSALGSVDSSHEAFADYGALRARATVRAAGENARGSAGSIFGSDPLTTALFEERITIGGTGARLFQLHYALTGNAGKVGPGLMQFSADLSLQAWGDGISIVAGPTPVGSSFSPPFIDTYGLSASGNASRAIGLADFLVISAVGGSTMNLSGALGAHLSVDNAGAGTETLGTLDLWNTAAFSIVPLNAGTVFTSASGHDYLASPVPEASSAALMLGALPLLAWALRRRRAA